jgi:carbonic anhydrase
MHMKDIHLNSSFLKIIQGVKNFQQNVYPQKQPLFKALAKVQDPKVLFITCSDSRIDPAMITQTEPGDMFLIHNAGNIVPPHGAAYGGTGASIEYAVSVLNVEHIIVCGHSSCGAMSALMNEGALNGLPAIKHWLSFAESTKAILEVEAQQMDEEARIEHCIRMNIPVQMAHLRTLPSVTAKLAQNKISLHGWVYYIDSGEIEVYNPENNTFIPFDEAYPLTLSAC